jgi:hypothetical protein
MKFPRHLTWSNLAITVCAIAITGCSDRPIQAQLQGKSLAEQKEFLVAECESEAWQGHDIGTGIQRHNRYKQENKDHLADMKRICRALAEPGADKSLLIPECEMEAQNKASFTSERYLNAHINRLLEICTAFGLVVK